MFRASVSLGFRVLLAAKTTPGLGRNVDDINPALPYGPLNCGN